MDSYDWEALPASAYLCNVYRHATGVAEHVFTLLLALRRRLTPFDRDLRDGRWPKPQITGTVQEIGGLTIGVVGFGRIGQSLVDISDAFGVNVVAMRSSVPTRSPPGGVEYVVGPDVLDRLHGDTDGAVLSLPLTEETEHLIGARELNMLGEDGYLINVARGPVVDEQALYDAPRERPQIRRGGCQVVGCIVNTGDESGRSGFISQLVVPHTPEGSV